MKNYLKLNYNFEPYEEKKEIFNTDNNNMYSTIQIDGFIHDLKKKGYNNSQLKDIISSIENNKIQKSTTNKYTPVNDNHKLLRSKHEKKIDSLHIIETDINQRKVHSYYNIKNTLSNNLNENQNKQINVNHKNKSYNKASKQQILNNNISNLNVNIRDNTMYQSLHLENKRKFLNIPYNKSNKKNILIKIKANNEEVGKNHEEKINNYYKYELIHRKNDTEIKRQIIKLNDNFNSNISKNIYIKKKKQKINITLNNHRDILSKNKNDVKINQENKYINDNNEIIHYERICHNNKTYLKIYKNKGQFNKSHKLNIRSSHIILQGRRKNNYNSNSLNYNSKNGTYNKIDSKNKNLNLNIIHNISKDKYSSKHSKKDINNLNINKKSNHSFYNSSYENINERKTNKVYSIQNSNKEKKFNKIYNNSSDRNDKFKSKNIINNTSKNRIIYRNSNNESKKNKNIFTKKEKTTKISDEKYIRDRNSLNNSYNKNQYIYYIHDDKDKNNMTIEISKRKHSSNNLTNIYNYKYLNSRNNSENKDNTNIDDNGANINHININGKNFYYGHDIRYRKMKREYHDGKYEGIIINNKREIKGIMYYKNGSKYEGQWKNDKKHGKGIFTSQNYHNPKLLGIKYEGEFNNDKIEGFGIGKYTSGDKYQGEWKNNKQYGRGILIYKGGGKYVGEWKNGKLNGNGIYFLKNGERFEGKFIDDKYNGYGKYYYNDGEFLEGIFKNDLPSGSCILHKIDGTTEVKDFD